MTIEYINRRRQKFYLHQGQTKTGKPKYFFSMKSEGISVDTVPDGYEIYENPNSQVFLRKTKPQVITPEELMTVKEGIEKYTQLREKREFMLDVKNKNIVIYICDQNIDNMLENIKTMTGEYDVSLAERMLRETTYSPMMQFILDDIEARTFEMQRWCFRGSVDDWITLDYADLESLVKKYSPHLGQESFFDLIPSYRG